MCIQTRFLTLEVKSELEKKAKLLVEVEVSTGTREAVEGKMP